ncbi:MAG: hypothetical protein HQK99_03760 [Nitrospirae bacterium]|nr:hypothetical protein [Nitrospirota bacterium]
MVANVTGTYLGVAMTAGNIYTVAGSGNWGYSGDGDLATSASLYYPYCIAVDSVGNLYISDQDNHRIRIVANIGGTFLGIPVTAGNIYTVAGNGNWGYSGDGDLATSATLHDTYGVALDSTGNLYIADIYNRRVRVVANVEGTYLGVAMTAGNIYTIAGNGTSGYSGDGGAATSATLDPVGLTVDSAGSLYIAGDNVIRKVNAFATFTVTPWAGANMYINPETAQTVSYGNTAQFTVTPSYGYTASVSGCGGSLSGNIYTTGAITSDCTVTATSVANTYSVTPSGGTNGTISPSTVQTVSFHNKTTFTITPNSGYTASVSGCSGSLSGNTYTTGSINANCTVRATFSPTIYKVTPSAGANGTISPATAVSVYYNNTYPFTVTPNTGYTASVGGTCGGHLYGNYYITNAITDNCTVVASFTANTANTYTVTPSAGANGTISPTTAQNVSSGSMTTFTVTPNTGYSASVGGTCGGSLVGSTYTTNAVTGNCTVTATFTPINYTVTPSAGANGTISPTTAQSVAYGNTTTFTVTPKSGYTATVGGTCGGNLSGNNYTTNAVTGNCTVSATFAPTVYYTVTPSAGANGTISPSAAVTVASGSTKQFTLRAQAGYALGSVTGCNGSLSGSIYTTGAITSNCAVTATFTKNTFTVTPSAGAGGAISPSAAVTVTSGTTKAFAINPRTGYTIASVTGCNGSLSGTTYTTGAITADCTVAATFTTPTKYTVTPSAGTGGTISPSAAVTVTSGSTKAFTISPHTGYTIASVTGCNGSLSGTIYTTGAITADCTVAATYTTPTKYTVTPTAGTGGTISPSAAVNVTSGSTQAFTVHAQSGYAIASVTGCNGSLSGTTYTTGAITSSCTVTATFTTNTFTVTPSAGDGGAISPSTPVTVTSGSTRVFTVNPRTGYTIASVTGCNGSLSGKTYTTGAITADCTVAATFTK